MPLGPESHLLLLGEPPWAPRPALGRLPGARLLVLLTPGLPLLGVPVRTLTAPLCTPLCAVLPGRRRACPLARCPPVLLPVPQRVCTCVCGTCVSGPSVWLCSVSGPALSASVSAPAPGVCLPVSLLRRRCFDVAVVHRTCPRARVCLSRVLSLPAPSRAQRARHPALPRGPDRLSTRGRAGGGEGSPAQSCLPTSTLGPRPAAGGGAACS